jgi:hypothetical protein
VIPCTIRRVFTSVTGSISRVATRMPRWHPVLDVTRVATTAEVVVGDVRIARHVAARPSGAEAVVTMGPGGWSA